jgi:hypothetical protein
MLLILSARNNQLAFNALIAIGPHWDHAMEASSLVFQPGQLVGCIATR